MARLQSAAMMQDDGTNNVCGTKGFESTAKYWHRNLLRNLHLCTIFHGPVLPIVVSRKLHDEH